MSRSFPPRIRSRYSVLTPHNTIDAFLERLYTIGVKNDAEASRREQMMLNITPSTSRFLDLLITDSQPTKILELGTSNGYSTIWIARAARAINAMVESVDCSVDKTKAAARNLSEVGLDSSVTLHTCDAAEFLANCPAEEYDFVVLDSARSQYVAWAADLLRVTRFGTLVVDNAISHPHELTDFFQSMDEVDELTYCVLPIGKGQMAIRKRIVS
jgi:predicted O-methyltransferase YrrM